MSKRLTANGNLTLSQLMDVIDQGVIGWWNSQHEKTSDHIMMFPFKSQFIQDLSDKSGERETNRIITYRKIRKNYGSLSSDPFGSPKEVRPRHRQTKVVKDDNGRDVGLKIFGRWYDYLIRFDCFAPTWSEAIQLEEDFDYLMDMFTGFIMKSGVNKVMYRGTFSDSFHYQTDYFYESPNYYFRLERHYFTQQNLVREFDVNINNTIRTILTQQNM